ncbi:MAG: hypothetical protein H5T40_07845 [Methanobacteriales archaeon]|nr:hypothetical protein [Methanobacteriales archaeon]BAW31446.1 conserved hypothetical protein [Methanothermobacter sp. MT-2]HHW05193.1 hypothetical protein [Methanothermobacter sp.]HOK73442.1 hypothetical protein [Methanothermobacter sp.]HOL69707.1 hypothetical protein [Methanothermobacter sp.]
MKQFFITPSAGKRLIAHGILEHPDIKRVLNHGILTIIAGTTNGYIAEELLKSIGEDDFRHDGFFRGITVPPSFNHEKIEKMRESFPGDIIIRDGQWEPGKTIFDVLNEIGKGDVILKGANALNIKKRKAAIYIGHPEGGTIVASLQAVVGRRAKLIIPVGLEKRVPGDLDKIAAKLNSLEAKGPRMLPVVGEIFTEIEAIKVLSGANAELVAAGGVSGAEGGVWLLVSGSKEEVQKAEKIIDSVSREPPYTI